MSQPSSMFVAREIKQKLRLLFFETPCTSTSLLRNLHIIFPRSIQLSHSWLGRVSINFRSTTPNTRGGKKGWSTGALLPEGNGQAHSCQKDLDQFIVHKSNVVHSIDTIILANPQLVSQKCLG